MAKAAVIDFWTNPESLPPEGPFVLCGGPVGAEVGRIEYFQHPRHATQLLPGEIYHYMKAFGIPRGYRGACRLNYLWRRGGILERDADQHMWLTEDARNLLLRKYPGGESCRKYGLYWPNWKEGP